MNFLILFLLIILLLCLFNKSQTLEFLDENGFCSFDKDKCIYSPESTWCNESKSNCESTNGCNQENNTKWCSTLQNGFCAFDKDTCENAEYDPTSTYCNKSKTNCESKDGCNQENNAKWCSYSPESPKYSPVPYNKCDGIMIDDNLIKEMKMEKSFIKAIYIAAWNLGNTKDKWREEFDKLTKAGYNVILLAFAPQSDNSIDIPNWNSLSCGEKQELKNFLIQKKTILLLSIGGALVEPDDNCEFSFIDTMDDKDNYIASYAYSNMFDGVDFDLEGFKRGQSDEKCANKLQDQAIVIRNYYGSKGKECIITSAPQTPYFSTSYPINYIDLERTYPNTFDFYNIQFYNNGEGKEESQLNHIKESIPKNKIVIGKCGIGKTCCLSGNDYISGKITEKWARDNKLKGIMYWVYAGNCEPDGDEWLKS